MNDDHGNPMTEDTDPARDPHGRYTRQVETIERDAQALRLRARGWTYPQIAQEMGYSDKGAAHKAVQRGLAETIEEPAAEVRTLELERLDRMYDAVVKVLETRHFTVSQGKVIQMPNEAGVLMPLADDAPVLAAVDRLLKIQERRAKLLGLDAPTKAEVGGQLTYSIVGVDLDQL